MYGAIQHFDLRCINHCGAYCVNSTFVFIRILTFDFFVALGEVPRRNSPLMHVAVHGVGVGVGVADDYDHDHDEDCDRDCYKARRPLLLSSWVGTNRISFGMFTRFFGGGADEDAHKYDQIRLLSSGKENGGKLISSGAAAVVVYLFLLLLRRGTSSLLVAKIMSILLV